jgi:hypothetical protein
VTPRPRGNPNGDLSRLRQWAAELEAAATISRQLAGTAFIPDSLTRYHYDDHGRPLDGKDGRPYRIDVDATTATAAAAILTGAELNLDPMSALRSITVINNTPALAAIALRGVLLSAGHEITVAESTGTRAIVRGRRDGTGEPQASTWTLDRAKTAGLYPGLERGQWRRNPTAMLVARATAECARWVAADALLGIPYIAEELIDMIEGPAAPLELTAGPPAEAAPAAKTTRTTRRRTPAAPPALPSGPPRAAEGGDPLGLAGGREAVDQETGGAYVEPAAVAGANAAPIPPEPGPDPGTISKPQLDRLHAGLRDLGITTREQRQEGLDLIGVWIGRTVTSTATLTGVEASRALDALDVQLGRKKSEPADPDWPPPATEETP